jgi:hypothetical protein
MLRRYLEFTRGWATNLEGTPWRNPWASAPREGRAILKAALRSGRSASPNSMTLLRASFTARAILLVLISTESLTQKCQSLANRLTTNWIAARVTEAARVSARFS